MKRSWSAPLIILASTISVATAGCAVPSATSSGDSPRPAAHVSALGPEVVKTQVWANERRRLLQFKAHMGAPPGSKKLPGNTGAWVYESLPINISRNGAYEMLFGPLDKSFDFPKHPTAVAFEFPWDIHFTIIPAGKSSIVSVNGKRYFKIGVSVTKYTRPYQGLMAWIY